MVAVGIVAADTIVDTGYTGPHFETVAPSKTIAQAKIEAQPGTVLVHAQFLFSPQSSLDMHLHFSHS